MYLKSIGVSAVMLNASSSKVITGQLYLAHASKMLLFMTFDFLLE